MTLQATRANRQAPRPHRWSRAQYERVIDAGLFDPGDHVELIGGLIMDKMSPQNSRHSAAIGAVQYALDPAFRRGYWVRVQLPLSVGDDSQPEPDIAVARGTWRDYRNAQPVTAVLVVEISDTTLFVDRDLKASLYASGAIADYWIVNLRERVLEVHRDPAPMADRPFGHGYLSVVQYTPDAHISPLAASRRSVAVDDLFP